MTEPASRQSPLAAHAIVVGVPRCGTTALFRYLAAHPQVASSVRKELNFFLDIASGEDSAEVLARYGQQFLEPTDTSFVTVEASPAYTPPVDRARVIRSIAAVMPDVRIILMLREPVGRLFTHFRAVQERERRLREGLSFDRFVEIVLSGSDLGEIAPIPENARKTAGAFRLGHYDEILGDYIAAFGASNVLPLFADDLRQDSIKTMHRVAAFLGITGEFYDDFVFTEENKTKAVRWPRVLRVALWVNARLELVLNRAPLLRRVARYAHGLVNEESRAARPMAEPTRALLQSYYASHVEGLRAILRSEYPSTEVPDWVRAVQGAGPE